MRTERDGESSNGKKVKPVRIALLVILATSCLGCAAPLLAGSSSGGASGGGIAPAASAAASDAVANPSTFDYAAPSTRMGFLAPAALLYDNPSTDGYVVREQCYFHTADPLFFVADETQQPGWDFVGRLDANNYFESLEYHNALTLGLTHGKSQLNTWPVELASLSDMPALFLQQRIAILAQAKLSPSDEHEYDQELMRKSRKIEQAVGALESHYDPAQDCPARKP